MKFITDAVDAVIRFFKGNPPAEDKRADPEDPAAYTHVAAIEVEQNKSERAYPVQLLRHSSGEKPTNEVKGWDDLGIEPPPTGYDSWVDVYEGPEGIGYVVNYEIEKGKVLYRKAVNFGPQTYREQDWTEVPAIEPAPKR